MAIRLAISKAIIAFAQKYEDESYLKDFCLSVPQYIQLDKIHDEAQDLAQN